MKRSTVRQTFLALAGLGAAGLFPGAMVAGCGGGGGGGGGVATAPIASANDAALFLQQATFGPTPAEIEHLQAVGYEYWLEEQFAQPRTEHLTLVDGFRAGTAPDPATRMNAWWIAAMRGSDQLRQRMAYALSQILVVSDLELSGNDNVRAMAAYQDTLCQNAFANYKDLLKNVSLSPVMGQYLSSVRNEKADPARNIRPDENYARELMQLFSIGLVQLNPDGTVRLDGSNNPIPTYDQAVIEGFAAVFTGFTYPGTTNWRNPPKNLFDPMIAFEDFHDTNAKTVLDGQTLPRAGRRPRTSTPRSRSSSATRTCRRSSASSSSSASRPATRPRATWRACRPSSTTTGPASAATCGPSSGRSSSTTRPAAAGRSWARTSGRSRSR
jgi:hypothetical protein